MVTQISSDDIDPGTLTGTWRFFGAVNNVFRVKQGRRLLTLEVVEDESDGYRSALERVRVVPDAEPSGPWPDKPFANVRFVNVSDGSNDPMWEVQDLEVQDLKPPHVWLRFGTSNADDYYPSFEFYYQPKLAK